MQEVEWFAARAPAVAHEVRAADRKWRIEKMKAAGDPLIALYERAVDACGNCYGPRAEGRRLSAAFARRH